MRRYALVPVSVDPSRRARYQHSLPAQDPLQDLYAGIQQTVEQLTDASSELRGELEDLVMRISRKRRKEAEKYGGAESEEDWRDYERRGIKGNEHYSDKGSHKERSKHHQPRHNKHWKKQRKKRRR